MDETLDWMDEFDDSVFTDDTIEANDSSALTGFDNSNTEAETSVVESPLEANETETINTLEDTTPISNDFFTNFTPTINFSMARAAGPSSMHNNASSKGDKPANGSSSSSSSSGDIDNDYGPQLPDKPSKPSKPSGGLPGLGGESYKDWSDREKSEAAQKAADAAEKESAAASAEAELADKEYKDLQSQVDGKLSDYNAAVDERNAASDNYFKSNENFSNVDYNNIKEGKTVTLKDGQEVTYYEYTGTNAIEKAAVDARNEAIDRLAEATADYENAKKSWNDYLGSYNDAKAKADAAAEKAKEALSKAQAAKEKAGTLAGEAKEAYERAEAKQKEWEQKQKEAEANEKDGGTSTSNKDSAVNNPVTFDLAKTLADAGAKMTETEYGQVADFVANHPEMASIISGGLTNAEKSAVGNVIAGIQAINAGNYLTAVKEFAQGFGMTLVSAVQLIASGIYGAGPRILGTIKSFMENPNINYDSHNKDFETFEKMRAEYGDSSELQALYDTAKGTTDQKQTFDYMKDNAATNVGEYNEGLVEDVNKVVSDASRKVIHYSPYVLEAVKKWRE